MSETITDSHCHLDYFGVEEVEAVVGRAREAGVGRMITIGTKIAQAEAVRGLIERFPDVWGTVGVHPLSIHEVPMPEEAEIAAAADHPRVVGIGETGLDYHYAAEHASIQAESFRRHIRVARRLDLPVVVHTRAADEDTARILREERESGGAFDVLLHCFSSGRALAEEVVAAGGHVSFSGILSFPKVRISGMWRAIFQRIACSWRRTRPISRRRLSAASAASRPMSCTRPGNWPKSGG